MGKVIGALSLLLGIAFLLFAISSSLSLLAGCAFLGLGLVSRHLFG